jgi:hypothetical protein
MLAGVAALSLPGCQTAPSTVATPTPTPSPTSAAEPSLPMDKFLALSALLTGFAASALQPDLGQQYLASLDAMHSHDTTLADMYAQCGLDDAKPPARAEDVRVVGLLQKEPMRELAEELLNCWYTGEYQTSKGKACATFVQALSWRSVGYTPGPGQCAGAAENWGEVPASVAPPET